jgi:hypothetical protein
MATPDYRFQTKAPVPAATDPNTIALIHAINTGWIGRGMSLALGMTIFAGIVWLLAAMVTAALRSAGLVA